MDNYHLEAFAAVAEELNFRRAADRLHVSPSPLSRHVRELEAELGAALFERDTRHVRLTPAGEALLPQALDILAGMANAARSVSRASGQRIELVVGMRALSIRFHRLLADTMAPVAPYALRVLPMETTVQQQGLLRGAVDIGIHFHVPDDRLGSWPILQEAVAIALPDEPRFRKLRTVMPTDVAGLQILTLTGQDRPESHSLVPGSGPYRDEAAGVVPGADLIPGGIAGLIADGAHCAFIMADPESPWHRAVRGTGVVVKRLPASFPTLLTSAVWQASRASDDDLAPVIGALKAAFPHPARH